LFLLCSVKSDFDEIWYEVDDEGKDLTELTTGQILYVSVNYANFVKRAYKIQRNYFSRETFSYLI